MILELSLGYIPGHLVSLHKISYAGNAGLKLT